MIYFYEKDNLGNELFNAYESYEQLEAEACLWIDEKREALELISSGECKDALEAYVATSKDYQVSPRYYEEGEITSEEARKQGMYALADALETYKADGEADAVLEEEWGTTSPIISAVEEDSVIAENRPSYEDGEPLAVIKDIVD